jgi:hypothetical protein
LLVLKLVWQWLYKFMRDENTLDNLEPEAMDNLVRFFELLLKIDQRINPSDYGIPVIDK